jgi:hypothetical protein
MGEYTSKNILRQYRALLFGVAIAIVAILAPWIMVRAASLFDNFDSFPSSGSAYFKAMTDDPSTSYGSVFDFSTTTNLVVCNVRLWLINTNATSGVAELSAVAGGTIFNAIPSYGSSAVTSSSPLFFYFDPCFTLAAGDKATFRTGHGSLGGREMWGSIGSTHFFAISTTQTRPEVSNFKAVDSDLNVLSSFPFVPIMQMNGIDAGSSPDPTQYGLTGTSTNPGDFGLFGNYFIAAMTWLFVPASETWQTFTSDAQETLGSKIPFGWFAQVSSTFGSLSDQETTSTVFTIYASGTDSTYSAVFFDPQAVEAAIPANVRTLIRTLGALAMWALFFVWIWNLATGKGGEDEASI